MKKYVSALCALTLLCAPAFAAPIVTITPSPTVGAPGFITYTVEVSSTEGDILGFNFDDAGGSGFGFFPETSFGDIDPLGVISNFTDSASDLLYGAAGSDRSQATYFGVVNGDGIGVNIVSTTQELTGAWNGNAGVSYATLPLAQIVLPENEVATFAGTITVEGSQGNILQEISGIIPIPEPATLALFGLGVVGIVCGRRRS